MRLLTLLSVLGLQMSHLQAAPKPNIVHIIADDMGYSDLGCYGGEIETPHLDRMAAQGLRFTNFYVNNMCWPTRASLMTGLYPRTALPKKGTAEGGLHPESITLPKALKQAGYTTLMCGKWHLSDAAAPDGPNAPHHRGFDHFYGTIQGASDFFAPVDLQLDGRSMKHEWENNPDYYYTDAIADHALQFLQDRDASRPFYLYVAFTAAHWPLHARPADIEHYAGRYAMGWDRLRLQRYARMKELGVVDPDWALSPRHPDVPAWEEAPSLDWQQRRMEVYAAQITCMDRNIGRILDHLRVTGELESTIFVYHHDNGGCHVEYGEKRTGSWTREFTTDGRKLPIRPGNIPGLMPGAQTTFQSYGYGWANASNTPFRLFKQYDHEGGTRSPLIVAWPAGMPATSHGQLSQAVSHAVDILPTLLTLADVPVPVQAPLPIEGWSLQELVTESQTAMDEKPRTLFWDHSKGRAVRSGNWKLVAEGKGDWELYHLGLDGTELHDLSVTLGKKVQDLSKMHEDWKNRTQVEAP